MEHTTVELVSIDTRRSLPRVFKKVSRVLKYYLNFFFFGGGGGEGGWSKYICIYKWIPTDVA